MTFRKKEDLNFIKIDESELSETERGAGGFGLTGIQLGFFILEIKLNIKNGFN